jgi:glutamate-1-semialdehyde aminotransferase
MTNMPNTVRFNSNFPTIQKSDELYQRSLGLVPAATQTLAKGPGQYVRGVAPKYLARGKGSHVWDVDGNEFIDLSMAIGPLSLGYCNASVDEAIRRQLEDGITFSLMHPLEVEVAELIREVVPNVESVRFSKTGADVTSAAVRLARAYTGRTKVLCCGYHGWHDWYIAVTDRNKGIPVETLEQTHTFSYNDIQSVEDSIDDDTACVILEPMLFESPKNDFLHELHALCRQHGVLLIFDEMWTGFRIALGGSQEYFDVECDLVCFSKAIANGMPISVLAGRQDIMKLLEKDVFFFTTFGGEALSLAATKATIHELRSNNVPKYLAQQGKKLKDGYNMLAAELGMSYTSCYGMDARSIVVFDDRAGNALDMKSLVQQEMIKRGVLWGGFHTMSYAHTDADISYTLSAYAEALSILRRAVERNNVRASLHGDPVEPVFRKTTGFSPKPEQRASVPI